ncbi:MAG TPA: trifunctional transcriptional activator/DNA repair protein Ada/methylated-DNA--[protein]-cysteine S-methyltransferase [Casimicrobiaceae bacterium]|jgi:AraC family transcriptional regulator of adaptative response/methylated-DNA-[protein]-cysteine methyltransferase
MYRALAARDAAFDGIFYVAVKTTRIFCRSVCHARTPKRENVEFFANPQQALYAGYRPCLRCRPLDQGREPLPLVNRLLAAVEADPAGRLREGDLARMGIEPSTARRAFQRYCGMTFHAYHRARRMGLALTGVREGKSMLDLQLDHGFESPSGFREAFAKVFGTAPSNARAIDCLYAKWLETPLGPMLALANDTGLHLLEFVDRRGLEREIKRLRRRVRHHVVPGEHRHLDHIATELDAYFSGRSLRFATPLQLEGSPFQQAVWNALLAIPAGSTRSYADIAAAIGHPAAMRAVGRANGDNNLSIVVPCHRVIGANGALTGYGGGLWRKAWLLEHERAHAGARGQRTLPGVGAFAGSVAPGD